MRKPSAARNERLKRCPSAASHRRNLQPASFTFSAENLAWAKAQIAKYPEGRQASAVIPILWRVQEQHEGWVSEAAIRAVADMLGMPYIRVLEVATFYTMFQLQPVGKKAHVQVCGTTPCRLRGAERPDRGVPAAASITIPSICRTTATSAGKRSSAWAPA